MDQDTADRFKRVEKRLKTLEKAVLPQPLEDDDAEVETDTPGLNTVVEGSDA